MQENIRRSPIISKGGCMVFLRHPISMVLLLVALSLLISIAMPYRTASICPCKPSDRTGVRFSPPPQLLTGGENLVVNYKSPENVYSKNKGIDA
jgi:hypothetical protein